MKNSLGKNICSIDFQQGNPIGKCKLFQQMVLEKLDICLDKNEPHPFTHNMKNIYSKRIMNLSVKAKTIDL